MDPLFYLTEMEILRVFEYVRSLAPSGPDDVASLPGDPTVGRGIYEAFACATCHTIGRFGTAFGPDLTDVADRRGVAHMREAILEPAATLPRGLTGISAEFDDYLVVRVVDADGNEVRGARLNEDTYTIQLKDMQGVIYSFYKPDLRELVREFDVSLMPGYGEQLTEAQVDDLVAYLASLTGASPRAIS
jgi:putative heme-binding domain-containing protein